MLLCSYSNRVAARFEVYQSHCHFGTMTVAFLYNSAKILKVFVLLSTR